MESNQTSIRVAGREVSVPGCRVEDFQIVVKGKWLKIATVMDEDYVAKDPSCDAIRLVEQFRKQTLGADLFSFLQRVPDVTPRYQYPMCFDNVAAMPINGYSQWLASLSQETRRNVRLASKRGVIVRGTPLNDDLIRGVVAIYNETPFRQGRKYWHFGKDFETIKRETSTYADTGQFIAAYFGSELIGFVKMVYVGQLASIMQIQVRERHLDKRPANALIAKAVELSSERGCSHLLYCKYEYHANVEDALMEFKRRCGFKKLLIPRYFVPLTLKGRVALKLNLHGGILNLLPGALIGKLLKVRSRYYEFQMTRRQNAAADEVQVSTGC